jgi:hypothetical protein
LIKPGVWSSAVEVNLTNSGTRVVVGMPGSKLAFTSSFGLRYTARPTTPDFYMRGVSVEVSNTTSGYGFVNCANLTNCTGTGSGTGNGYGFINCANLSNCTGSGNGNSIGYGFGGCKGMLMNKPGSASTNATYNNCYVSPLGAAPADSLEGGWNIS